MSKRKQEDFNKSIAEVIDFLNPETIEEAKAESQAPNLEPKEEEKASDPGERPAQNKKDLGISFKEPKSRRVQVLLKPTIYKKLETLVNEEKKKPIYTEKEVIHITINDMINRILERYFED